MTALVYNFDGVTPATTPAGLTNLTSSHVVISNGGVADSRSLKPVTVGALTLVDLPASSDFEMCWDWIADKLGTPHFFSPNMFAATNGTSSLNNGAMVFMLFGDGGNGNSYFEMKPYEGGSNYGQALIAPAVGHNITDGDVLHFKVTVLSGMITIKYWKNDDAEPTADGQAGQKGPIPLAPVLPAGAVMPGRMMLRGSNELAIIDNARFENLVAVAPATKLSLHSPGGSTELLPSGDFTVLLDPSNGTLSGNVVVTPNSSGGGGTFTPTTVTLTPASPIGRFKYTAATSGTKQIAIINNGGLQNPTALSLVVSPFAPATAIAITGPATGPVAEESQAFRITANGPLITPVVVTPTASGVTFTPSTVTLNGSFPNASFKATSATAQTVNIALTNNGSLTNPAPLQYISAAAVVKYIGVGLDFGTIKDFAKAYENFDCYLNRQNVIGYVDENMSLDGAVLKAYDSNDEFRVQLRPSPGKGHQDLDKTGALGYGTLGIELTLAAENVLALQAGGHLFGFRLNITGYQALKMYSDRQKGMYPKIEGCKIKQHGYSGLFLIAYSSATVFNNLIIREQAIGGPVIDARGQLGAAQNTFVLRGAGTAEAAVKDGWGGGSYLNDNVFYGFGSGAIRDVAGWSSTNNYANAATSYTNGVIVDSTNAFFMDVNNDLRPGLALIGKGRGYMASTNDVRGNNRGGTPDVGSAQKTPAEALAVALITSQTFSNGTLTINGTYTNVATGARIVISPVYKSANTAEVVSTSISLNNGTFTAVVPNIQFSTSKQKIDLRLSNSGGFGPKALGASLISYLFTPATAVALSSAPLPIYWQPSPGIDESTRKVEHRRNGVVIGNYTEIGDLCGLGNQAANLVKNGDEVWVYPAVYHKKIMMQPNLFDGSPRLENVAFKGIVVNGQRPIFIHNDDAQTVYSQGPIYFLKCQNVSWDNIDVNGAGGWTQKALMYINEFQGAGVIVSNTRIMGAFRWGENGVLATSSPGNLTFINVESGLNGGDTGPPPGQGFPLAHGFYCSRGTNPNAVHRWTGCYFHDSYKGHLLKARHNNVVVEGCYFSIGTKAAFTDVNRPVHLRDPNNRVYQSGATCFDFSNGGNVLVKNNIFAHSFTGEDAGTFCFAYGPESRPYDSIDGHPWRKDIDDTRGKLTLVNNTFVAFSDKGTKLSSSGGFQDTVPANYLNYSGFPGEGNPDSPDWDVVKQPVDIRDNVYAGFTDSYYREPTALILTLDEINLPGIDPGVPFSPKVPVGSSNPFGGSGSPMYAHQAKHSLRTDSNKGAVGIAETITPSGYPAITLASPMTADRPGYPLQYEWSTNVPGFSGNITVVEVTTNGFKLKLPTATDEVGIDGYKYSLNNGANYTDNGPSTDIIADNLLANTSYPVLAKAYNTAGRESATLAKIVKTGAVATALTLTKPTFAVIGTAQAITVGTDIALIGNQTQMVTLSDGQGGTFVPPTLSFSSTVATLTSSWMPAGVAGNRTITAVGTGNPVLTAASVTTSVTAPVNTTDPQLRTITVTLRNKAGAIAANLSGIKGAVFDTPTPNTFTAPIHKFADGTTDANGKMILNINTVKPTMTLMGLAITNSDGSESQNPPAKSTLHPVTAV